MVPTLAGAKAKAWGALRRQEPLGVAFLLARFWLRPRSLRAWMVQLVCLFGESKGCPWMHPGTE